MLTVNSTNTYSRVTLIGNINRTSMRSNWSLNPQCWSKINQYASVPPSCQTGNAYVLPMKTGAISAFRLSPLTGSGAVVNASLKGQGVLVALVLAGGDIVSATSHIVGMKQTSADLNGTGHVHDAMLKGDTEMAALICIGFQPSAYDIAQAVWNAERTDYENPDTMGEQLSIIRKLETGRWKIDPVANTMTFYDPVDNITPILVVDLLDALGNPVIWTTMTVPFERMP